MDTNHGKKGPFMYYKDYSSREGGDDIGEAVNHNHKTGVALVSKLAAKMRGRGGRFRGKNGARENNKARGGKLAR